MLSEGLSASKKVIAFLSNDMFEESNRDNWSDVSLSLAIAVRKSTFLILLEDIDDKALNKRSDLRSALKVSNDLVTTTKNILNAAMTKNNNK